MYQSCSDVSLFLLISDIIQFTLSENDFQKVMLGHVLHDFMNYDFMMSSDFRYNVCTISVRFLLPRDMT